MVEYQVMLNSSALAQQIARGLVSSGVTEVVIAPGSRSAPLVYALAPLAEAGVIRTHVRIDERDAGFLALGLARGHRAKRTGQTGPQALLGQSLRDENSRPGNDVVALVTTSGSAVANLHPAILEASYGHLPLIAITADRPARLRGTGANQTIDDQSQVLSDVRARFDVAADGRAMINGSESSDGHSVEDQLIEAVTRSVGEVGGVGSCVAGPVQFNVQFDAPLVPTASELSDWKAEANALARSDGGAGTASASCHDAGSHSGAETKSVPIRIMSGTVIVAGDASGHSADSLRTLAEDYGIPVLSEPSSPLAFASSNSNTFVPAHAQVLTERTDLRDAIRTVIVHGRPTLTRPVAELLADTKVLVQRMPDDIDAIALSVAGSPDAVSDGPEWCHGWVAAGREILAKAKHAREERAENERSQAVTNRANAVTDQARAITEYLAASAINLFVASSNSIRYLNELTDVRARIHASRGLAGIDGLVSTATGLSLALGEQVVIVIGDIAMLHDVGGLLTPSAEERGDVVIVVLNDDGGAIFSGLEHSQEHVAPYLERYFTVPHGREFGDLAAAYGWEYARVTQLGEPGASDKPGTRADLRLLDSFIAEFEKSSEAGGQGGQIGGRRRRIIEVNLS